jgi:hypothetical protein
MLRQDIVDAAEAGEFHVYPVVTVDQALELLTGLPCGERDAEGKFPDGSINQRVEARLIELAERQRDYASSSGKANGNAGEDEGNNDAEEKE